MVDNCSENKAPQLSSELERFECDFISETFQPLNKVTWDMSYIQTIKIIVPQFIVGDFIFEEMIAGDQDRMSYCNSRLLLASATNQSVIESGKIGSSCSRSSPSRLQQCLPQPSVALTGLSTLSLSRTLVIPGTEGCPGRTMAMGGKTAHIHSDLGNDPFSYSLLHSRDRYQKLYLLRKRDHTVLHLLNSPLQSLRPRSPSAKESGPTKTDDEDENGPEGPLSKEAVSYAICPSPDPTKPQGQCFPKGWPPASPFQKLPSHRWPPKTASG